MSATAARPRLTPHQREVYSRIVHQSRRHGSADADNIGSRQGVEHLVAKGYVRKDLDSVGPRGREHYRLTPLAEVEKWLDTMRKVGL